MSEEKQAGTWAIDEGVWLSAFKWFLVDDGLIQYSFKTKYEADLFKTQGYLSYMLTTDIKNLANDTMLDAYDDTNWAESPTCVSLKL